MNRREFTTWSQKLTDDDFACALAAAGVVDKEGLLRVVKGVTYWRPVDSTALSKLNASQLATTWKKFVASYTDLRLSIPQPWTGFDPEWITECLMRPAVGLGSVSLSPGRWDQPTLLRQPHISIAGTIGDNSPYEILIASQGLNSARFLPPGTAAKGVVALGPMPDDPADTQRQLEVLRAKLGAGAAAAVLVSDPNQWVNSFRQLLLKGIAFDLALTQSLRALPSMGRCLLIENEEWLERDAELSDFKAPIRQGIHPPIVLSIVEPPAAIPQDIFVPTPTRAKPPVRTVRRVGRNPQTGAEIEIVSAPPSPRHLQARVAESGTGASVFTPGSQHRIEVRIGEDEVSWITDARVFDESKLPKSKSGHTLTVVFVEPALMKKPQTATLHLPPNGSSTSCKFSLRLGPRVEAVAARIIVLYRNRVLQTSLLRGKADGNETPHLEPEVAVSAGFAGLDEQPKYDAALVFNHTTTGLSKVTGIAGDSAVLLSTGDLDKTVRKLEDALATADWGAKEFSSLDAPGTCELLLKLAAHGRILTRQLEARLGSLAKAARIQLVAAKPGARLPVEYFYSYAVPGDNWKLCPNAKKTLSTGVCGKSCGALKDPDKYLCPLGFWGLSKVLEWQTFRPEATRELSAYDYKLEESALTSRKQLQPLTKAVLAASDRANAEDKKAVPSLMTFLKKAKISATEVSTWDDWKKKVKTSPALLILIPHTDNDEVRDVVKMEIGNAQWLTADRLEKEFVSQGTVRPVVLLLGCETGQQHVQFEDLVSQFMVGGAAVVVSSLTTILGRHAAPLAQEFVESIERLATNKKATFGDVMLDVRRTMMRKGKPMVMSVSSYGDADWKL